MQWTIGSILQTGMVQRLSARVFHGLLVRSLPWKVVIQERR